MWYKADCFQDIVKNNWEEDITGTRNVQAYY